MRISDFSKLLEAKDVDYLDTEVTIIKPSQKQNGEEGGESSASGGQKVGPKNVEEMPEEDSQQHGDPSPKNDKKNDKENDKENDQDCDGSCKGGEGDEGKDGEGKDGGNSNKEFELKPGMKVKSNVTGKEGIVISVDKASGKAEVDWGTMGIQTLKTKQPINNNKPFTIKQPVKPKQSIDHNKPFVIGKEETKKKVIKYGNN